MLLAAPYQILLNKLIISMHDVLILIQVLHGQIIIYQWHHMHYKTGVPIILLLIIYHILSRLKQPSTFKMMF